MSYVFVDDKYEPPYKGIRELIYVYYCLIYCIITIKLLTVYENDV